jgi:hypothetical protein
VVGVVLLPAFVIAELRGPIFAMDGDGGGTLLVPGAEAAADVVVGLLGTATIVGGGLGWLTAGSRRAAGTTVLAALAFALGPGHNIPLLGGTSAVAKELVILAAVVRGGVPGSGRSPRLARATSLDRHQPGPVMSDLNWDVRWV